MYLKINKLKIKLEKVDGYFNKLKCLMFVVVPLDHGFVLENQNHFNTYFACQPIDAIITDKNNKVLKIFKSCKSEKFFHRVKHGYYTYFLPNDSVQNLKKDDTLKIYK